MIEECLLVCIIFIYMYIYFTYLSQKLVMDMDNKLFRDSTAQDMKFMYKGYCYIISEILYDRQYY